MWNIVITWSCISMISFLSFRFILFVFFSFVFPKFGHSIFQESDGQTLVYWFLKRYQFMVLKICAHFNSSQIQQILENNKNSWNLLHRHNYLNVNTRPTFNQIKLNRSGSFFLSSIANLLGCLNDNRYILSIFSIGTLTWCLLIIFFGFYFSSNVMLQCISINSQSILQFQKIRAAHGKQFFFGKILQLLFLYICVCVCVHMYTHWCSNIYFIFMWFVDILDRAKAITWRTNSVWLIRKCIRNTKDEEWTEKKKNTLKNWNKATITNSHFFAWPIWFTYFNKCSSVIFNGNIFFSWIMDTGLF